MTKHDSDLQYRDHVVPEVFFVPPKTNVKNEETPLKQGIYSRGLKRLIDTVCVLLGAPLIVPLVGIFSLAVFIQDRKNPFFKQLRVGRGGHIYTMWKLRSMVPQADTLLQTYLEGNAEACAEWASTQKLKKDPRVTPLGRFMRAASLDELPQLWNVLNGSMSLVGPRPILPEQGHLYPGTAYYTLRPGITGLWQVSSRNEASFADRALFDDQYALKISFFTDLRLLLKTVQVVWRATGY